MSYVTDLFSDALNVITNEMQRAEVARIIGDIIENDVSTVGKCPEEMNRLEREKEVRRVNEIVALKMLNLQLLQARMQEDALKEMMDNPKKVCDAVSHLKHAMEAAVSEGKYGLVRSISELMLRYPGKDGTR